MFVYSKFSELLARFWGNTNCCDAKCVTDGAEYGYVSNEVVLLLLLLFSLSVFLLGITLLLNCYEVKMKRCCLVINHQKLDLNLFQLVLVSVHVLLMMTFKQMCEDAQRIKRLMMTLLRKNKTIYLITSTHISKDKKYSFML